MQTVFAFMMTSLDGYYVDSDGELGWHNADQQFMEWNIGQLRDVGAVILGRKTYQHFEAFWTTSAAHDHSPEVAKFMNSVPKVVVSHSARQPDWQNTSWVTGDDLPQTLHRLRSETSTDIGVFASSQLTVTLLEQQLVDELRVMVNPVLLGAGSSLYEGLQNKVELEPLATTVFSSGNILLRYRPWS